MESSRDMTPPVTAREVGAFALIVLAGLVLWYGTAVAGTSVLCGGDLVNNFYPMRIGQLERGWFGGWQPETFGGRPFFGEIQSGAFYPPNWLHLLGGDVARTTTWLTLLHLAMGAVGFFVYTRERFRFLPAAVAAFLWAFGNYNVLRMFNGVVIFIEAFAWLPWMLWAAEGQSLGRAGVRRWGWLALFGGMQVLAGAPQPVQLTWAGLAVWTAGRMAWPGGGGERWRIAAGFLLAGLLALAIASPLLAGVVRFQAESYPRTGADPWTFLSDGSLHPRLVLTWLLPDFFAEGTLEAMYWGSEVGYPETQAFVGLLPVLLAGFAVALWRPRWDASARWGLCLGALAVLAFLVALGRHGFLFRPLTEFVPTFGLFRVPARWIVWVVVAVAVGAAFGLERLLREEDDRPRLAVYLSLFTLTLGGLLLLRVLLLPALEALGLGVVLRGQPPALAEAARDRLAEFSSGAVDWALAMVLGGAAAGALLLNRRMNPLVPIALLLLLGVADLFRSWLPFRTEIPDLPPPLVETEAEFAFISAARFHEYFYPRTPAVEFLAAQPVLGRWHSNNTLQVFYFDQNQRELIMERPIVHGFEITRGYQQSHLRSYVEDYYASLARPEGLDPGAFLPALQPENRLFFDAYNVTHVLAYAIDPLPAVYTDLGFEPLGGVPLPLPPEMQPEAPLAAWRNPGARGWAWLSESDDFLRGEADPALGDVVVEERLPDAWTMRVRTAGEAVLHISSPDFSGWSLEVEGPGPAEVLSSRSVRLGAAGEWSIRRVYTPAGTRPWWLALALGALGVAVAGIAVGKGRPAPREEEPAG